MCVCVRVCVCVGCCDSCCSWNHLLKPRQQFLFWTESRGRQLQMMTVDKGRVWSVCEPRCFIGVQRSAVQSICLKVKGSTLLCFLELWAPCFTEGSFVAEWVFWGWREFWIFSEHKEHIWKDKIFVRYYNVTFPVSLERHTNIIGRMIEWWSVLLGWFKLVQE